MRESVHKLTSWTVEINIHVSFMLPLDVDLPMGNVNDKNCKKICCRNHQFNSYTILLKKLTYLTRWYTHLHVSWFRNVSFFGNFAHLLNVWRLTARPSAVLIDLAKLVLYSKISSSTTFGRFYHSTTLNHFHPLHNRLYCRQLTSAHS